ncbi:MAG: nuclear transport factor 2 family protein [Longibaculum sp.]
MPAKISNSIKLDLLTRQVIQLYFSHQDFKDISGFFDEKMSCIVSVGKNVYTSKKEIEKYFQSRKNTNDCISVEIITTLVNEIKEDVIAVMVMLKIQLKDQKSYRVNLSLIWRMGKRQLWKIVHMHYSN